MDRPPETSSPAAARQGPEFSVIITCYFEEKSIDEFHGRLTRAMQGPGWSFPKLWSYYMDHMVGISQRPFQILSALCLGAALFFTLRILVGMIFDVRILSQVTPGLLLNVLELNLLITLGVLSMIGEYVIRNFIALRKYPIYVVREMIQRAYGS